MSGDAKQWRWVGEDGVERSVSEHELIAELSSETLPSYTLVWRKGWCEWLPAMQVAELNWTLPAGKAAESVKPKERQGVQSPPAPPLYRYPVIKRRAASGARSRSNPPGPRSSAPPPPEPAPHEPGPSSPPALTQEPTGETKPTPAERASLPLRAEDDFMAPESETEPRREMVSVADTELVSAPEQEQRVPSEPQEVEAILEESGPSHPAAFGDETATAFAQQTYSEDLDDAETHVMDSKFPSAPPAAAQADVQYVPPHSPPPSETPPESYEEPALHIPPPPAAPRGFSEFAAPAAGSARPRYALVLGGAVALLGIVVLTLLATESDEEEQPAVAPTTSQSVVVPTVLSTTAPSADPTAPPLTRCSVLSRATQLADSAWADVQPAMAAVPGLERVAVGFALSKVHAVGLTIDPMTLDKDQVYRQHRDDKRIVSVTPTTAADSLKFQSLRESERFRSGTVVNASRPYRLGLTSKGISRRYLDGGDTELIWKVADRRITTPRVAELPGFGHAVTFRAGGKAGAIRFGWLDPSGDKRSELATVASEAAFFGTPSVAENGKLALLTFAARTPKATGWSIYMATAEKGQAPTRSEAFALPPGGPGGNAISPVAASLPDGRWVVQWTEGASGNRRVRVQVLDRNLKPASEALDLSGASMNAGQGLLWARGETLVSLFLVQTDDGHELWGASLECKRDSPQVHKEAKP